MLRRRSLIAFVVPVLLFAPLAARGDEGGQREHLHSLEIRGNAKLARSEAVRSGRGTPADPFVIAGWEIDRLSISDTTKAIRIEDNSIRDLTLNWTGPHTSVHHNDIGDLRVNENVPRREAPTSGHIAHNAIGVVGQLRHFDGMFMHNVVGEPSGQTRWPWDVRAVNFDGFNGAHFAHNTIYGTMEARLHGHHHSSGFGEDSHMHAEGHHDMVDHTKRWHEVSIHDNTIITSSAWALTYTDSGHVANDRTAASETDESLEEPHVHFTRVNITDNTLIGGGLTIDVFNAEDSLHRRYARGRLIIDGNDIRLRHGMLHPFEYVPGIWVIDARAMDLRVTHNRVRAPEPSGPAPEQWQNNGAGLVLDRISGARILIEDLRVSNRTYGIQASGFSEVTWIVRALRTSGVTYPMSADATAGQPKK